MNLQRKAWRQAGGRTNENKSRGVIQENTGRNISMNNKREGCQWTLQNAELMEEKGKEEKRPMSHCCRSLSPYMEVVFSLSVCVCVNVCARACKWEGDKTSRGKNKICFHICRLHGRFQNALWHQKTRTTRTYKKKYVERLEEGWGGQRRRMTSQYCLWRGEKNTQVVCPAEPKEWQEPSHSLVTWPFPPSVMRRRILQNSLVRFQMTGMWDLSTHCTGRNVPYAQICT